MLPELTEEQQKGLQEAIKTFKGYMPTLEAALGALFIGQAYGWRVLKVVHSPATIKKYEKILGFRYDDVCPEVTDLSKRSVGYSAAEKLKSFWAVATGKKQVPNKADLKDQDEEQGAE